MNLKLWIEAFRLRTLPLALSNALMGSLLAWADGAFRWYVFILAMLTILSLQILSNLANDYGDATHGTDNARRIGPRRFTQSGMVSMKSMRYMIGFFAALSLVSGLILVFTGLQGVRTGWVILFIAAGLAAIWSAIRYTIGNKPYGYAGMGDLFVFIFFGIVGVMGTYYLHTHDFNSMILLPAATVGLLSTGVLNLNNMRDIENDRASGKMTLAVRLGSKKAKRYHYCLVILAIISAFAYAILRGDGWTGFLFIPVCLLFLMHLKNVASSSAPADLNPELKRLAFSTFLFTLVYGLGMVMS